MFNVDANTVVLVIAALGAASLIFKPRGKKPIKWTQGDKGSFVQYTKGKHWVTEQDAEKPIKLAASGVASEKPMTVMDLFKQAVNRHGSEAALRVERDGAWVEWTWSDYYADTIRVAKSYVALGVEVFDSVNIIGFNSPEWLLANMGAIACGAKAAGIYTTNGPDACKYITEHSHGRVVVVEDEKQLEKFLQIRDELPDLKAIVVYNGSVPKGANAKGKARVMDWAEFLDVGKDVPDAAVTKRMAAQRPGHCCTLIYTSGTTGNPKAVMISHDNLTWTTKALMQAMPTSFGAGAEHIVSYLPLSHIAAQILDIHAPMAVTALRGGCGTVHFARPDALKGTLGDTLKAVRPTLFFGVPRVWEKIHEKMKAVGAQTKGLKRTVATWAKGHAAAASLAEQAGGSGEHSWGFWLADRIILRKIHAALGLDRCHSCYTGAAPIGHDTLNYFGSLHIPVLELYGMSECTGPQTVSRGATRKVGTCGPSLPGCELKLDHDASRDKEGEGEICFRGRHIMMGYMFNPEKTQETIDDEGWLHSGDVGRLDEHGLLHITGRIKELIITAGGENIAPVAIENRIKELLPCISNIMMVGDKRKYNVALVTLKTEQNVETGAFTDRLINESAAVSSSAKTVGQAQKDPVWQKTIEAGIKQANSEAVSNAAKIQKFRILPEDFSVPGGELTSTLKLKRSVVAQKYAAVVEEMY